MPIYEYKCKNCGNLFEDFRLISERDAAVKCPMCGKTGPERVISNFWGGSSGSKQESGYGSSCSTTTTSFG